MSSETVLPRKKSAGDWASAEDAPANTAIAAATNGAKRWTLRRRLPARSPQNEQRRLDLAVLVGRVHLEVDPRAGAIVAAGADDRFLGVATDVFVGHDLGWISIATTGFQEPFGRNRAHQRLWE